MAFTDIIRRVATIADEITAPIQVVEGIRTEDLPTPCINVILESATEFHPQLTDVYRVNILVRYEEHYGDTTGNEVNNNFKELLDQFIVDDLASKLSVDKIHVFKASITDIGQDVDNDMFLNEFTVSTIMERDS
jgi:hypothetical protein